MVGSWAERLVGKSAESMGAMMAEKSADSMGGSKAARSAAYLVARWADTMAWTRVDSRAGAKDDMRVVPSVLLKAESWAGDLVGSWVVVWAAETDDSMVGKTAALWAAR